MSHFSVVVCIDGETVTRQNVEDRIGRLLAPYDENREMEPYRSYEEGEATGHWLYGALKRAAADYAAGTGIKPYKPDELGWSSASSKQTPQQQRAEQKADAELFHSLPDPFTWADLAKLYAARYGADSEQIFVDDEGRAYTMSTYNPDSKWDYWRIGGRWGGYFPYRAENARLVLSSGSGWDSPDIPALHCDGGPKSALDLDALRQEKGAEARKTWAEFAALVAGTPEARPWSEFVADVDAKRLSIDEARTLYHAQPRWQAISQTDFRWTDDAIGTFQQPEDRYVAIEVARAVPGYATVRTDGKWMAPGRMGWFGVSTDEESERIGYWEAANAYIESLPDTAWLVAVDCHI